MCRTRERVADLSRWRGSLAQLFDVVECGGSALVCFGVCYGVCRRVVECVTECVAVLWIVLRSVTVSVCLSGVERRILGFSSRAITFILDFKNKHKLTPKSQRDRLTHTHTHSLKLCLIHTHTHTHSVKYTHTHTC